MLLLYNSAQLLLIILFFPFLLIYCGLKTKYRQRIPLKLGKNLRQKFPHPHRHIKTIWIHALSVGEVTSACPLVSRIRQEYKDINIVFSASTKTGSALAEELLQPYCDQIIVFPLDISWVIRHFLDTIQPDLFILVETDFWPNFLHQLQQKKIPAILVNGRISKESMRRYRKFRLFFTPMFRAFSYLCVQNESDRSRLLDLGVADRKILQLGNLKYEALPAAKPPSIATFFGKWQGLIIVAGSTHRGEEGLLLQSFMALREKFKIHMIIAPRDIQRGREIIGIAKGYGLSADLRSTCTACINDIFILDTIGELVSCYALADICFVGGSLVREGGHNPIEPAKLGKPVIVGAYMDDFEEICADLLESGGAFAAKNEKMLTEILTRLIADQPFRQHCGNAAHNCIMNKKGMLDKHIELIREIL